MKEKISFGKRIARLGKKIHRQFPWTRYALGPAFWIYFTGYRHFFGLDADVRIPHAISHKYKFINPMLPKNASNMMGFFYKRLVPEEWQIEIIEEDPRKLLLRKEYTDYFVFGFVRNPWERVVSCYLNKIVQPSFWVYYRSIVPYTQLRPDMPFDEFVDFLIGPEGRDDIADRHWISQTRLVTGQDGRILYDFIGSVENFYQDWEHLTRKLSLPRLPQEETNKSDSGKAYMNFYSDDAWKKIERRYQSDIELFGYKN